MLDNQLWQPNTCMQQRPLDVCSINARAWNGFADVHAILEWHVDTLPENGAMYNLALLFLGRGGVYMLIAIFRRGSLHNKVPCKCIKCVWETLQNVYVVTRRWTVYTPSKAQAKPKCNTWNTTRDSLHVLKTSCSKLSSKNSTCAGFHGRTSSPCDSNPMQFIQTHRSIYNWNNFAGTWRILLPTAITIQWTSIKTNGLLIFRTTSMGHDVYSFVSGTTTGNFVKTTRGRMFIHHWMFENAAIRHVHGKDVIGKWSWSTLL